MSQAGKEEEVIEMNPKQPLMVDEVVICDPNKKNGIQFIGLNKEQLKQFENDPYWRKIRIGLFIAFWIIWVAMLVAAIVIIVITPKCAQKPPVKFWQEEPAYLIDPYAFKDSDGDFYGDIKGVIEKLDYVKQNVLSKVIILDSIFGKPLDDTKFESLQTIDKTLGSLEDMKSLLKSSRKSGTYIILAVDAKKLKSKVVIKDDLVFWLELGVRGFLLKNADKYSPGTKELFETVQKFGDDSSKDRVLILEGEKLDNGTDAHAVISENQAIKDLFENASPKTIFRTETKDCKLMGVLQYAAVFLFSSAAPLVSYSNEIGFNGTEDEVSAEYYPGKGLPRTNCHLPMQWNFNGTSDIYVERALAIGEINTRFQLHQKLAKLRSPSNSLDNNALFFGKLEKDKDLSIDDKVDVATRSYKGFSTHIIVLQKETVKRTFDFSSICEKDQSVEIRLVYPENEALPVGKKFSSSSFVFQSDKESVYVLACV